MQKSNPFVTIFLILYLEHIMKILLSWLKEYLPQVDPITLPEVMTRAGIEVDRVEEIVPYFAGVISARVQKVEPHPNCTKLRIAKVSDGKNVHTVVCAAPNCKEGLLTAYAPLGAKVAEKTIGEVAFGSVHSQGMLCSEKELGLSEHHEGIVELASSMKEGSDLAAYFCDTVYEVSLTPNLGHCQSIMGCARELSAFLDLPLAKKPWQIESALKAKPTKKLKVTIENSTLCPRYSALMIEGLQVVPSPSWIRIRLERSGHRSVNNIVDATNYVSHELGQPLHAFDADRIHKGKEQHLELNVSGSKKGDTLSFLDEVTRPLPVDTIVIRDSSQILAAGGIMGGEGSSILPKTQNVVLESAYFNPSSILKARTKLCIITDSAKRFERGADFGITLTALEYALELLKVECPSLHLEAVCDEKSAEMHKKITCRLSRTSAILGFEVSTSEMESAFSRLFLPATFDGQDIFTVEIPSFRHDLKEEVDLIEEVGRLVGLDRGDTRSPKFAMSSLAHDPLYLFETDVRRRLLALGLQEVMTGDLISPEMAHIVTDHIIPEDSLVKMLNPLSAEQSILRPSLLPGLLDVVKRNIAHRILDLAIFEIGHAHLKKKSEYQEPRIFSIMLTGMRYSAHFSEPSREVDFFDLKGLLENQFHTLGYGDLKVGSSSLSIFHPGRQAKIFVQGVHIGMIGELHPQLLKKLGLDVRVLFAECDFQELMRLKRKEQKMKDLALFPASERDLTLTCSKAVTFGELSRLVEKSKPKILESTELTSIYQSEKLGAHRQNLTLRFVYRDLEKTVSQEEVEKAHGETVSHIMNYLAEKYPE